MNKYRTTDTRLGEWLYKLGFNFVIERNEQYKKVYVFDKSELLFESVRFFNNMRRKVLN